MDVLIPLAFGLVSAVIINYLADVLPRTRQLSRPTCKKCDHLFSILDYLLLKNCSQCQHPRGMRPVLVIIGLTALNLYLWVNPPLRYAYWSAAIMLTYMALVFVIDAEHRLILHPTSLVGFAIALIAGWYANGLLTTILGGLTGFVIMFVFYYLGVLLSRYRARKMQDQGQASDDEEALGAGDVILSGILGLALGYQFVLKGLFLGIVLAGLFGALLIAGMMIARRYKNDIFMVFMPYGPFLILGAFFWMFILPTTL